MTAISVRDETFPGRQAAELTLEFLTERVTLREVIRARVYQEVTEYNAARALAPGRHRLIEPTAAERLLNGVPTSSPKRIDWEPQFERALQAFRHNGFLLLVDDQQCDDLDAEIELRADTRVTFLRLVPLAGG
jgi:hypothetical protein